MPSGDLTAAQNAFGQGLSLTAVQLAAGYASFANGGLLVTPHVVAGWTDPDGTIHDAEQPPAERIMREETADTMVELLTNASTTASQPAPRSPGYTVAGKTGTAQIAGPRSGRGCRWPNSSSSGSTSTAGSTPASSDSCRQVTESSSTLVLIHRPGDPGPLPMARPPGDGVRAAHAADARLPRDRRRTAPSDPVAQP